MGNLVGWARVIGVSWLALALLVFLVGCGSNATGSVSGKVTFEGKPVVFGSVTILGSDKKTRSGTIDKDGHFTVEKVAVGEAHIGVISPNPNIQGDFKKGRRGKSKGTDNEETGTQLPKEVLAKWFPISPDYENPEKSGFTLTVQEGTNPFDITLTKAPPPKEEP